MERESNYIRQLFERASTGIYYTLFENCNEAILIFRFSEIIKYNSKAKDLFGFPQKNEIFQSDLIFPLYQPDGSLSKEKSGIFMNKALDDIPLLFEWTYKKCNGDEFVSEVSLSKLDIGINGCVIAIVRDITVYAKHKLNEEQFHTIFNSAPVGISRTSPQGKIILANNKLAEIFDYENPESIISSVSNLSEDIYHSWKSRNGILEDLKANRKHEGTYKVKTSKGSFKTINLNAIAKLDKNGELEWIDSIVEDITYQKLAEEALKESEERYRYLMENMNEVVMIVDNDDRVQYVNKKFTELFGYSPDEIIGKIGYEILLEPHEYEIIIEANKMRTKNITSQYEICFKSKDGKKIDFLVSGAPIYDHDGRISGSIGTMTDITDRKKAEKTIIQNEMLLRNIIQLAPYPIVLNSLDGKYLMVNYAFTRDMGYEPEEIIGKTSEEAGLTFDPEKVNILFQAIYETGKIENLDISLTGKNGKMADVLYSGKIIDLNNEKVLLSSSVDITEKKKIQNELEEHKNNLERLVRERTEEIKVLNEELTATNEELYQNNEELNSVNEALAYQKKQLEEMVEKLKVTQLQLIQSEKMASIGILTAGVAHEINNPVNFISSGITAMELIIKDIIEVVKEYSSHCEDIKICRRKKILQEIESKYNLQDSVENISKLLQSIHIGVERTTRIIKSLRTFSRMDAESMSLVDIHQLIDSSLTILNNKIKDQITIEKQYDLNEAVNCFPGKLNQVFMNLFINAIQATEKVGLITIITKKVKDKVEIIIRDTGHGIPKDVQMKIFDPFFTTKPVGEGTGMGLSIVHGIIKDHKGEIFVRSKPGKGTEFKIVLPGNPKA